MTYPDISPNHVHLNLHFPGTNAVRTVLTVEPACGHRIFEVLAGDHVHRQMEDYGIDPEEHSYDGGWMPGWFNLEQDGTLSLSFKHERNKRKAPSITPFLLDLPRILDTLADNVIASRARYAATQATDQAKARARLVTAMTQSPVSSALSDLRVLAVSEPEVASAVANLREVYGAALLRIQAQVCNEALITPSTRNIESAAKSYGLTSELDAMRAEAAAEIHRQVTGQLATNDFELRITPHFPPKETT